VELNTAQELVIASAPEDWERWDVPEWPSEENHGDRATFRADVGLELWWGRTIVDDFTEPWTSNFPDAKARSFYVDATYGGAIVLQEALVYTDGGRYMLPIPRIHKPDPNSDTIEYRVDHRRLVIARLLHGLTGAAGYGPDAGIQTAGFTLD